MKIPVVTANRLNLLAQTIHVFDGHGRTFDYGRLGDNNAAKATYLRLCSDLIEQDVEVDIIRALDSVAFYYCDEDEIVSLIVAHCDEEGLSVVFAWTHPGHRRMGLFTSLMNKIVSCFWESETKRLRTTPPISNEAFDAAIDKLGFKPVSLVCEYLPFQRTVNIV